MYLFICACNQLVIKKASNCVMVAGKKIADVSSLYIEISDNVTVVLKAVILNAGLSAFFKFL